MSSCITVTVREAIEDIGGRFAANFVNLMPKSKSYCFSCPHRCHNYSKKRVEERCRARCVLVNGIVKALTGGPHNHLPHTEKIAKIQKRSDPLETALEYWPFEQLSDVEIGDEDIMM